jgi:hypothetical protein
LVSGKTPSVTGLPLSSARTSFACAGLARPSALRSSPDSPSFFANAIMKPMWFFMSCSGHFHAS